MALDAINLLGICQGGVFSLCYAALHPDKIRNLITMVTPVDFHTADNMLSQLDAGIDVDLFVDTLGNVPADLMNLCYLMLKPCAAVPAEIRRPGRHPGRQDRAVEDFLRMEKWIFDSPDQAGEAFRQFIKQFYQGNGFVNGGSDRRSRSAPGPVEMPMLNIFAEQDHLVPPDASRALSELIGSDDYTELSFKGGHIGIYVSGRAQAKSPAIHDWLGQRAG